MEIAKLVADVQGMTVIAVALILGLGALGTAIGFALLGGKFLARCTQEAMDAVLSIAADPLGKAIEHGKLTGRCAICNRKLTDEDSTGRGIGPICAEKFGWSL